MSDPMAEIRASFFIECEELLEALQDGLQTMYDGAGDGETVNVVFRAVHSIKGGAGAFGLDGLVSFAHRFETALDEVRGGNLVADAAVLKLFFTCNDILGDLVRESRDGIDHDRTRTDPVLTELDALLGGPVEAEASPEEAIDFEVTTLAFDLDLGLPDTDTDPDPTWRVRFQPGPMLYANGNEPLFLFRALRDLGELDVTCHDNDLPPLADLDCEHAHLGWDLSLTTSEDRAAIAEAFDFVEGRSGFRDSGAGPRCPRWPTVAPGWCNSVAGCAPGSGTPHRSRRCPRR